ncbi:MAG: pyruvate kinase alpha/beta domain-containing protein, partial [Bacteriovoracaceae bacterium]
LYPVEAVLMMGDIVEEAEKLPKERPLLRHTVLHSVSASIQVAASIIAEKTKAKWVLSVTQSGNSCLKMSRFRPKVRVLGCTNSLGTMRKMTLYWGITPFFFEENEEDLETLQEQMIVKLKEKSLVVNGDKIVITHGDGKFFKQGSSNSVRLEIIKEVPKVNQKEDIEGKSETLQQEIPGGRIILDTTLCASCQNCIQVCPHDIYMVEGENNDTKINPLTAKHCSKDMECVEKCPTGAIEIIDTDL